VYVWGAGVGKYERAVGCDPQQAISSVTVMGELVR